MWGLWVVLVQPRLLLEPSDGCGALCNGGRNFSDGSTELVLPSGAQVMPIEASIPLVSGGDDDFGVLVSGSDESFGEASVLEFGLW